MKSPDALGVATLVPSSSDRRPFDDCTCLCTDWVPHYEVAFGAGGLAQLRSKSS